MPTRIHPPAPEMDVHQAFRCMTCPQLINFLCAKFGYNRHSLDVTEYLKENDKTVTWIRSFRTLTKKS